MSIAVTAAPETVGLAPDRLARIDNWLAGMVDSGKLAGCSAAIMRRGQVAYFKAVGKSDIARGTAMDADTIVRIYSMTKPLTSVAIMMLYEEGRFQLDDPISKVLPEFKQSHVYVGGSRVKYQSTPAARGITYRDLLTHTSGLSYAFMESTTVDGLYRSNKIEYNTPGDRNLREMTRAIAALPLLAHPGSAWNYSNATDVLGCLVQEISGVPFDDFMRTRILAPLGMVDTDFTVAASKLPRFATNYFTNPKDGSLGIVDDGQNSNYAKPLTVISGGGGLTGTIGDYLRFCQFMLNKGTLDGVRLLGRKTVELMTSNHLRGDMAAMGASRFSETTYDGIGFGLGFAVTLDPAQAQIMGSAGSYAWGGAASTVFWCDPAEDMAVVFFTQLMPSSTYPVSKEMRVLAYQAIVD